MFDKIRKNRVAKTRGDAGAGAKMQKGYENYN